MSDTIPETEDSLDIPWSLSFKNPDVVAAHKERHAGYKAQRLAAAEKAKVKPVVRREAKSITTAPEELKPATASKPEKAVAPKPAPAAKPGAMSDDAVITVLVDSFPHRAGTQAEAKSALLKTGMTVAEYYAAGSGLGLSGKWHIAHLKYCVKGNFIKIEG